MNKHLTVDQLESMKTHELADLLAHVVLILKRMPNVECRQLAASLPSEDPLTEQEAKTHATVPVHHNLELQEAELKSKKVADLRAIAINLGLTVPTKLKKDELITKILARSSQSHSEQYAIQNL